MILANILGLAVVSSLVTLSRRGPLGVLVTVALALAACGGSSAVDTASGSSADPPSPAESDSGSTSNGSTQISAEDAAAANLSLLEAADDARDHEVLDVADGSISSLRTVVDGDRPVLIWFWAPH